jgi:hypothetical protein
MPDTLQVPQPGSSRGHRDTSHAESSSRGINANASAGGKHGRDLRQRFKEQVDAATDAVGREVEELNVKLRKKVCVACGVRGICGEVLISTGRWELQSESSGRAPLRGQTADG